MSHLIESSPIGMCVESASQHMATFSTTPQPATDTDETSVPSTTHFASPASHLTRMEKSLLPRKAFFSRLSGDRGHFNALRNPSRNHTICLLYPWGGGGAASTYFSKF